MSGWRDGPKIQTSAALRSALQRWLDTEEQPQTRLDALRTAAEVLKLAEEVLEQRVLEARSFGHSWAEVADEVGITRQSAHRRWRHLDPTANALAANRERHFRPARTPASSPDDWDRWRPESR